MTRRRLFLLALTGFGFVVLCYGPLFAWSPITPGFVRAEVGRIVYLHRPASGLRAEHERAAASVPVLEEILGLSFGAPIRVVLCDQPGDFRRFMPWLPAGPTVGARTLQLDAVVYVSPLVRNRADAADFIRHELVHVLLLRNASFPARLAISRHWWVIEGLGVHLGNPLSYVLPPRDRLAVLAPTLSTLFDPDVAVRRRSPATLSERYALAGALVAYLIERHGLDAWRAFLHEYLANPGQWRAAFEGRFGAFGDAIATFDRDLAGGPSLQPPAR
jgi:hypothetical protein